MSNLSSNLSDTEKWDGEKKMIYDKDKQTHYKEELVDREEI